MNVASKPHAAYSTIALGRSVGFGSYDWWKVMTGWTSASDVYVLRVPTVTAWSAPSPFTFDQLRHIAQAAGRELNQPWSAKMGANVVGVTVFEDGGKATVDVVFVFETSGLITPLARSPEAVVQAMEQDSLVAPLGVVPKLATMGRMTGPAASVAHWRSMPPLTNATFQGEPTQAWLSPVAGQFAVGQADAGASAANVVPAALPVNPPPTKPSETVSAAKPSPSMAKWALGASVVALVWAVWRAKKSPTPRTFSRTLPT